MRRYSQFLHFQPGIVQGIFSHRFCRGVLDQLSNHWNEKLSAYTRVGWYIASYHTEKFKNKNITIQVLQRRSYFPNTSVQMFIHIYCFVHPIFCFRFLVKFGNEVTKILRNLCLHFSRQDGQNEWEKTERKSCN